MEYITFIETHECTLSEEMMLPSMSRIIGIRQYSTMYLVELMHVP